MVAVLQGLDLVEGDDEALSQAEQSVPTAWVRIRPDELPREDSVGPNGPAAA